MGEKIGILDSGVGGLSVLYEVFLKKSPKEIIFLGDTKYFPYGIKSVNFIRKRTTEIIDFFLRQGVDEVIIACNTASAIAYEYVLEKYSISIYSIVLTAVNALKKYNFRKIGVLATRRTTESKVYPLLINKIFSDTEVFVKSCSEGPLLETIEKGIIDGEIIEKELVNCMDSLINIGIDGLILGCTHLPFVKPVIRRLYPDLPIIDPSEEIIQFLSVENSKQSKVNIFVTGDSNEFQRILKKLLLIDWNVKNIEIDGSGTSAF
ncbi:MAG TPA: glutamate racemase [Dictyoglomaceae bacterium]|nr:glutamate racemase [Dictyoglomaceae bacterium]HOL38946.1 glutamate racemase [Dictyoglomaceae bacterium]HPP15637.1 glutamate racemase [Dictyoglomaceae bacterium]HPU44546.1 glutamate racemase [Dictyoglomaceae bacterium]